MKTTDDYEAKIKYWASDPKVTKMPNAIGWPPFSAKKFSSYREMNDWKKQYLLEIARNGGLKWTN